MKYRFSAMTGRLTQPTSLEIPTKFRTGPLPEAPVIHYPTGTTFPKTLPPLKGNFSAVPQPLLEKMTLFQLKNGLPVHIRGGRTDKILYLVTALVCGYGLFDCVRVYYHLSYPEELKSKLIWGR